MARVLVKPTVEGAIIRFPNNLKKIVAAEGSLVEVNAFWSRRLRSGELTIVKKLEVLEPNEKKKKK